MTKKFIIPLIIFALLASFGGCEKSEPIVETKIPSSTAEPTKEEDTSSGSVYFFNAYPELEAVYKEIADEYEKETGITVKIESVETDNYNSALKEKLEDQSDSHDAPTIFQIKSVSDYRQFKDYTKDIYGSAMHELLNDKSLSINNKGNYIYCIPMSVKAYGIIYNKDIMQHYYDSDNPLIMDPWEIRETGLFKDVVEDMTMKKDRIGIKGVFPATPLGGGQRQLFNVAAYYEYWDENIDFAAGDTANELLFSFDQNFKEMLDLYLNNSTIDKALLSSATEENAVLEFARGDCAMIQGGTWIYNDLISAPGSVITADNLAMLPIFIGGPGEVSQGLCVGSDNYFALNIGSSERDINESLDFLEWLYTSSAGKDYVVNKLNFIPPYTSFAEEDIPYDKPLDRWAVTWVKRLVISSVPWRFEFLPSYPFEENFGKRLIRYAGGEMDWETVKEETINEWGSLKAADNE
ncbi:MAG: ABC transporter substrate-binding protein [Eubacterium sp.]|jgi:raffinose/stachyose/melibiose transport system substrate-binding protein|nr:ABC transporter substrate-binding protein [Eubacterium sp.]